MEKHFRYNKLKLKKGVFTPQYDTEGIVDLVKNRVDYGVGLEVGIGTGAISIAIASETNNVLTAIDINKKAIKLAKKNAKLNKVDKFLNIIESDFFKFKSSNKFDFLVSNPPYIDFADQGVEEWVKTNQPHEALYAAENGLLFYKSFLQRFEELLTPQGIMFFEIGEEQKSDLAKVLSEYPKFKYEFTRDISGKDRYLVVELK